VTLRVIRGGGGVEITKTNFISVVLTPVANFTAAPQSGPAPLLVQFTDTSDGDPIRYSWQFGDQITSTEKNPYHLYESPGIYTVSLTVSNREGSDTKTIPIEVTSIPVAAFSADVTSGQSPLTVQFEDRSTGQPTSWLWKFGDGGSSTVQNPVHVFADPGVYSVQLTAGNNAGAALREKMAILLSGRSSMQTSNLPQATPTTRHLSWSRSRTVQPAKYGNGLGSLGTVPAQMTSIPPIIMPIRERTMSPSPS